MNEDYLQNAQNMAGSALGQVVNAKIPTSIRDRVCEANKRAENALSVLSKLTREVEQPLIGLSSGSTTGEDVRSDPTLSSDLEDLVRTLSRIEGQVSRLSVVITGTA